MRHTVPLLLVGLLSLSCFSTIAPDEDAFTGEPDSGTEAWVRGKVSLFFGPGDWKDHPTAVRAVWLAADGRQVDETSTQSGNDGLYRMSSTHPDVASVKVAAYKCEYDPADPAYKFVCCQFQGCEQCESPWDTEYTLQVAPGATAVKDIRLSCPQGP
jgi:hypothetical protein